MDALDAEIPDLPSIINGTEIGAIAMQTTQEELEHTQRDISDVDGRPSRYVLMAKLGIGSYGSVYSARDQRTGTLVAIKKTEGNANANGPYDQGLPVTMIREAAMLKAIRHENVIQLIDIFMRRGRVLFVFELCYCNLRQHIGHLKSLGMTTMEASQLRSYTRQILSAVAFFHEKRILHRDMKPDNILLDQTKQIIKIADFGMARPLASHRSYTERCVTAWYRPPEIILGNNRYGAPVDIWSTGCILAEMMNLCPVFRCSTEFECMILAFKLLGTPTEETWPGVSTFPNFLGCFPKWPPCSAESVVEVDGIAPAARDLLCHMLRLNPDERISARWALEHHSYLAEPGHAATHGPGVGGQDAGQHADDGSASDDALSSSATTVRYEDDDDGESADASQASSVGPQHAHLSTGEAVNAGLPPSSASSKPAGGAGNVARGRPAECDAGEDQPRPKRACRGAGGSAPAAAAQATRRLSMGTRSSSASTRSSA